MNLIPIGKTKAENQRLFAHPDCQEHVDSLDQSIAFFDRIGYDPPWIGYIAQVNDHLVGVAAYKGKPQNGRVEIAYGTFPANQQQGIGTQIARHLVLLAEQTDPSVTITARTLPEENYSTRILRKNGFIWQGVVHDDEDGDVWEWVYQKPVSDG